MISNSIFGKGSIARRRLCVKGIWVQVFVFVWELFQRGFVGFSGWISGEVARGVFSDWGKHPSVTRTQQWRGEAKEIAGGLDGDDGAVRSISK